MKVKVPLEPRTPDPVEKTATAGLAMVTVTVTGLGGVCGRLKPEEMI